jgi:hypothetical protein
MFQIHFNGLSKKKHKLLESNFNLFYLIKKYTNFINTANKFYLSIFNNAFLILSTLSNYNRYV